MALTTFPYVSTSDAPRVGARAGIVTRTEVTTARSGSEKRRKLWPRGKGRLDMDWSRKENAYTKADAILAFFEARGGRAESFIVFDFNAVRSYTGVHIGVMTAGQTVLNLPCRNATSVTVKLDGVTKAGTLAATAGANGRDRFTLSVAATGGELGTVSFTGQRAYAARFDIDELTLEYLTNLLVGGLSIPLIEVFNEE